MDAQAKTKIIGGDGTDESPKQTTCEVFVDLIPILADDRLNLANLVRAAQVQGRRCYISFLKSPRGAVRISVLTNLTELSVGVIQK